MDSKPLLVSSLLFTLCPDLHSPVPILVHHVLVISPLIIQNNPTAQRRTRGLHFEAWVFTLAQRKHGRYQFVRHHEMLGWFTTLLAGWNAAKRQVLDDW